MYCKQGGDKMDELKEIGKRIEILRKEKNISQDELAKKVGYKTRSSINKIEKGETSAPQFKIVKIAEVLETTPDYIMGWKTNIAFSEEEKKIILAYRKAKEKSKSIIKQILDIE